MTAGAPEGVWAVPARGVGEVGEGDDLVGLLTDAWHHVGGLQDGDVVVVTSKVVSKAEGRVVGSPDGPADKDAVVACETDRELARRGTTRVVRTRHGFVMAAAGVDGSNVTPGSLLLLPEDPDGSARRLRAGFARLGVHLGVVISDTSGRAWRNGQTDVALGAAGLVVLDDHRGRRDPYGNPLAVTAPAVADEIASAAELATGKLSGAPACLLRGLDRFVLPAAEHGTGAAALVRPEELDMFGLGAREAVAAAVRPDIGDDARGFGAPAPGAEVVAAITAVVGATVTPLGETRVAVQLTDEDFAAGLALARAEALLRAHGWRLEQATDRDATAVPDL
jgi:coenzyme F420-0:L-glutamate ligase / coenzyme F420-1:gamma-L-glutamate ligase